MAFRSGTNGEYSAPNSAHLYIQAINSAGTLSLAELAGSSSGTDYANVGLISVLNAVDETETLTRQAENSRADIKVIAGNRKKSYTVEAVVGNDVNLSLANGVIAVYDSTPTDVAISSSPESIYGDVIIMFLSDESGWDSTACVSERGERMENCLIKCMGTTGTLDGKGMMTYRFEITPFKDSSGNLYTSLAPKVFDASADYLSLSGPTL